MRVGPFIFPKPMARFGVSPCAYSVTVSVSLFLGHVAPGSEIRIPLLPYSMWGLAKYRMLQSRYGVNGIVTFSVKAMPHVFALPLAWCAVFLFGGFTAAATHTTQLRLADCILSNAA
tara:strand:- start:465 stop:815 length:351 start_codon:yes stop_codon:yes gene_type:complete